MDLNSKFQHNALYQWYLAHKRDLPWRETTDPYVIWLSEIILQQTRVQQGLPYFHSFLEKYPTVFHLAEASLEDVLSLWQGLGYYSRARNMWLTAREIAAHYAGNFPASYERLLQLKGVGAYTAAAIASFAFGLPHSVCDGNVLRVIARYFMIEIAVNTSAGERAVQQRLSEIFDVQQPALFNQAIMELGAMVCTPQQPLCSDCPLRVGCLALKHSMQSVLPLKLKKAEKRIRYFHYLVIYDAVQHRLLFRRRVAHDIWQGLYDFLLWESNNDTPDVKSLFQYLSISFESFESLEKEPCYITNVYKQTLSHQIIIARFYVVKIDKMEVFYKDLKKNGNHLKWVTFSSIASVPKPVVVNNFLKNKFKEILNFD